MNLFVQNVKCNHPLFMPYKYPNSLTTINKPTWQSPCRPRPCLTMSGDISPIIVMPSLIKCSMARSQKEVILNLFCDRLLKACYQASSWADSAFGGGRWSAQHSKLGDFISIPTNISLKLTALAGHWIILMFHCFLLDVTHSKIR